LNSDKKERKAKIREIENHLRHYKSYKAGIENIKQQLECIMPSITTRYEAREGTTGTFDIRSKVEDAAIDRIEGKEALELRQEKEIFQVIVNSIDRAIDNLEENERLFVVERYINLKRLSEVAEITGYHESYLNEVRNKVMGKLLISLGNILKL